MDIAVLILPVFAVIVAGWIAGASGYLPREISGALIAFAYRIAMPALVFLTIAQSPLDELLNADFLLTFGGGSMAVFLAVAVLARFAWGRGLSGCTMLASSASMTNTGFVALPLLEAVYGARGVPPAAIATAFIGLVMFPVVILLLEADGDRRSGAFSVDGLLRQVFLNPVMLSTASGLAWALLDLPLSGPVADFGSILGHALTPCALFSIGLSLSLAEVRQETQATVILSGIKLVAMPLAVFAICRALGADDFQTTAAVVCAAVPTAKTAFVLAGAYSVETTTSAATIALTTLMSIGTLFAWLLFLL